MTIKVTIGTLRGAKRPVNINAKRDVIIASHALNT
jgi:hypothetical protein